MTTFTDLPDDVVCEILCAAPDFATLSALSQVSKAHTYSVYRAHKRSILYAITTNLIGVCLPDAFQLLRCTDRQARETSTTDAIMDALLTITSRERCLIEDIHNVMPGLEATFSQT